MEKVRYSDLLPWEFRQRLAAKPVAYLPLGTLEWHGEHLPLGSDAIQSEGLMIECAKRFGGIVHAADSPWAGPGRGIAAAAKCSTAWTTPTAPSHTGS